MTARRHRTALAFVAIVGAGVGVVSAAATAVEVAPRVGDRVVGLHIVDQTFAVGGDAPFTASIELTGTADELADVVDAVHGPAPSSTAGANDAAAVRVSTHAALTSTAQLTAVDADGPGPVVDTVDVPAGDVFTERGAPTGDVTVTVVDERGGDDGLVFDTPGVHPMTIEVLVGDEVVATTMTFVESIDPERADSAPLAVSIMAAVADPGPWPSPTELSSAAIEVARAMELADAVDGPLSISMPPGLVTTLSAEDDAAADVVGTSVPGATQSPDTTVLAGSPGNTEPAFGALDTVGDFRDAFRGDELIAAPAIAFDPSSLVAVDQSALLTEQLRAGEDVLLRASPRAIVSRAVWFSRGPVSASAMVALRNLGIRMLVVSEGTANDFGAAIAPDEAGLFPVALTADGTLPGMTVSALGSQLLSPASGESPTTANEAAVRLLVDLHLERMATDAPAVVLATPRVMVPDPAITAQFVDLASETPDISVVPLSRLPGIVDGALSVGQSAPVQLPATAGPDLSVRLARVTDVRIDASHAARMLVESERAGVWDAELTRTMSTAIDDATAFEHLDATRGEIERVLGAIVPPAPETLRLTGTSSTLRLRLESTYDEPLNVLIHVRSPKLRFPEPDPLAVVPPGESVLVEIPVQARSNGTFTIEVDVLAPDRAPLADPVIITARVTRLTGLSQVITGAAALVLASWWYSHIRRSRRRRQSPGEPAPLTGDALGDTVSPDAAAAMTPPTPSVTQATSDPG